MSCLLLRIALSGLVRDAAHLQCDIETLQLLEKVDADTVSSDATACTTMDAMLHNADECANSFLLEHSHKSDTVYRLYNETMGQQLLDAMSLTEECTCPVLTMSNCKERCENVNSMRTYQSPRKVVIVNAHKRRAAASDQIRTRRRKLIATAKAALHMLCTAHAHACTSLESLTQVMRTA